MLPKEPRSEAGSDQPLVRIWANDLRADEAAFDFSCGCCV